VLGRSIDTKRWIDGAERNSVKVFQEFCKIAGKKVEFENIGGLGAIIHNGKAIVLGHPLWHTEHKYLNTRQKEIRSELSRRDVRPDFVDVRDFRSKLVEYYIKLT